MTEVPRRVKHGPGVVLWVEGLLKDGSVVQMHYAYSDGDGFQPAFEGWYTKTSYSRGGYIGVNPIAWRMKDASDSNFTADLD